MNMSKVTYLRRFNLGDYQHEEFSAEVTMEEGESFAEAHEALGKLRKLFTVNSTKYIAEKNKASKAVEELKNA